MGINQVQQEVLLIAGTSFSAGRLFSKGNGSAGDPHLRKEQLYEACWNGRLYEMLPEVWEQNVQGGVLYLWQIKEAVFFLGLELGEYQGPIESQYSINPYSFLDSQTFN